MADDKYTFEQARIRLEEIAVEVRKKDTSLEKSLDLLEEGVRLANICTELVDHTDMGASVSAPPSVRADSAVDLGGEEVVDTAAAAEPGQDEAESDEDAVVGASDAVPAGALEDDGDGFEDADEAIIEPSDADPDD